MGFGAKKKRLTEEEEEMERKKARLEELVARPLEELDRDVNEKNMDLCQKMLHNEEGTENYREVEQELEELQAAIRLKKQRLEEQKPEPAPVRGNALADALPDMTEEQVRERYILEKREFNGMRRDDPLYEARAETVNLLQDELRGRSKEGQRLAAERKEAEEEKARNQRRKAALSDLETPKQHLNMSKDGTWWKNDGERQWQKYKRKAAAERVEQIAERMGRLAVARPEYVPAPLVWPSGKLPQGEFDKALNGVLEASDKQAIQDMKDARMAELVRLTPALEEDTANQEAAKEQAAASEANKKEARRKSLQAGRKDRKADPRNNLDAE